ncbi:MAG: hypothetical protein CVU44_06725 [Chloroflexi bacterium HGW-Chloroflexi-6]|nr:MAG: hypothetical protein CVU44_06725 [Chloroflexi bacterium HGW-Chloroflexi-6]
MTKFTKILTLVLLAYALVSSACIYIVLPEGLEEPEVVEAGAELKAWSAAVTGVGKSESGDLRIDLSIRNDTGDWSAMQAAPEKPAILAGNDGKTANCETVFVGTGGHRLAPGFQTRGYTNKEGTTQLLYVECKGTVATAGAKLSIEYVSFNGILDDYDPEANQTQGFLELDLDKVTTDLTYPIAAPVEGLIQPAGTSITGLSDNVVTLLDAQRTETGLLFTWQNFNPTKFPLKTHIGIPPVIGSDGIIYGAYEIIDMAPVPITPPKENMEWTTEVAVPEDITGFHILLSVESNKPRTYINYAIDISNK